MGYELPAYPLMLPPGKAVVKRKPRAKGLSFRHQAFINAYFQCNMNATDAYLAIKPTASRTVAGSVGGELMKRPEIRGEIERRISENIMSPSEVLTRLSDIARASEFEFVRIDEDGRQFFDFNNPKAKEKFHIIKKIKQTQATVRHGRAENATETTTVWTEVELHDSLEALDKIARYHHLLVGKGVKFNIDLNKLTTHQLSRLASGDDLVTVLLDR